MARIVCLFLLSLSLHSAVSEDYNNPLQGVNSPQRAEYVCNVNESWLEHLENTLLNKSSHQNVFKHCKSNYEQIKNCCTNPLNCKHKELKHISQNLKEESLTKAKEAGVEDFATCNLNNLTNLLASLNGTHNKICSTGIKTCEDVCKDKLITLQNAFRDSFMIPDNTSIDEILKKAQAPPVGQIDCYNKMKEIAKKYKDQTLHKKPFRQRLKVEDIIDCDKISLANTRKSLDSFALKVCREAQSQKQAQVANQSKTQQEIAAKAQNQKNEKSSLAAAAVVGGGAVLGASTRGISSVNSNNKASRGVSSNFARPSIASPYKPISISLNTPTAQQITPVNSTTEPGYYSFASASSNSGGTNNPNTAQLSEEEIKFRNKAQATCKRNILNLKQIVHQSVKAPRAGRLEDEPAEPFDHYDLIRGKPAGMIVRISLLDLKNFYKYKTEFDKDEFLNKHSFFLSYAVNGIEEGAIKCSENLSKEVVEYEMNHEGDSEEVEIKPKEEHCEIKWSDLKENKYIYKFIPLYTHEHSLLEKVIKSADVTISAKLKMKDSRNVFAESCQRNKTFSVEMISPKTFNMSVMGIESLKCLNRNSHPENHKIYDFITEDYSINKFIDSKELNRDFSRMFPLTRETYDINKDTSFIDIPGKIVLSPNNNFVLEPRLLKKIRGSCVQGDGVIDDFINLYNKVINTDLNQVIVIVEKDYIKYHGKKWVGLHYPKLAKEYKIVEGELELIGDVKKSNIVFVSEEWLDKGTALHELAHSFGQLKEGYRNDSLKDYPATQGKPHYYCKQFTPKGYKPGQKDTSGNIIGIPCPEYRVTGGLVNKGGTWKLLNNQKSIMGSANRGITRGENLNDEGVYNKWIDRETYNKALDTLKEGFVNDPNLDFEQIKWWYQPSDQKTIQVFGNKFNCNAQHHPFIKVSGIYDKTIDKIKNLSIEAKFVNVENMETPYKYSKLPSVESENKPQSENKLQKYIKIQHKYSKLLSAEIEKKIIESKLQEYIRIQLKKEGSIIDERIIEAKFYAEYSYVDHSEYKEMNLIPIYTEFFPPCDSFDEKNMIIEIKDKNSDEPLKKESIEWKKNGVNLNKKQNPVIHIIQKKNKPAKSDEPFIPKTLESIDKFK